MHPAWRGSIHLPREQPHKYLVMLGNDAVALPAG